MIEKRRRPHYRQHAADAGGKVPVFDIQIGIRRELPVVTVRLQARLSF